MTITTPTPEDALVAFEFAWMRAEIAYRKQQINSEASLQAHIFAAMCRKRPDLAVYCAARIENPSGNYWFVDMVVCDAAANVLLLIELKYKPNIGFHRCGARDDIEKLLQFRGRRNTEEKLKLQFGRYRASAENEPLKLTLTNRSRLVFASISRADPTAPQSGSFASLQAHIARTYLPKSASLGNRKKIPRRLTLFYGVTELGMLLSTQLMRSPAVMDA